MTALVSVPIPLFDPAHGSVSMDERHWPQQCPAKGLMVVVLRIVARGNSRVDMEGKNRTQRQSFIMRGNTNEGIRG